jgi:hypothetical protein
MPKIKSPEAFAPQQVLTSEDLQNHVDGAFPVPGFISEHTTVDLIAGGDQFIIHDVSTAALRKVTFQSMCNANQPITASTVTAAVFNAPATRDVVIGPIDGANITGRVFTSTNGVLVTVDHVAHGLVTGQNVTITASVTAYSGFYTITVTSVDAFTYTLVPTVPATAAASGTCSYKKEGTVLVNGNISTIENLNANGSLSVGGTFRLNGSGFIGGNLQLPAVVTFAQPPVLVNTQIKPRLDYFIQTRAATTYTSGWGGNQNLANIYGTKLTPLDITFTPRKAGNTIVLNWTVFGEAWNSAADTVFLVTRTPNSGVGAGVPVHLPNAVDDANNTWSGVTTGGHDANDATTPSTINIKIVDFNSLDVSTTYSVHFRAANNRTTSWHLNRSINSAGALDHETGMSVGHAHEIYV